MFEITFRPCSAFYVDVCNINQECCFMKFPALSAIQYLSEKKVNDSNSFNLYAAINNHAAIIEMKSSCNLTKEITACISLAN